MKKLLVFLRLNIIPLTGCLLIILLFSACKKNIDTGTQPPVAGLMAFNLAPDKESIGITISGNSLTNFPLLYTNYTGGYQGVYVGTRNIASYDFYSRATLASTIQLFEDSTNYSVFVLGANGNY